jgi:hypothetical protein
MPMLRHLVISRRGVLGIVVLIGFGWGATAQTGRLAAGSEAPASGVAAADSPLAAAILPSSRSVETGVTATAFATMINAGATAVTGCGIAPATSLPAGFFYQTTNPATNALTGSPNTPADIAAGGSQTFVFGLTPFLAIAPIDAQFNFGCTGVPPAAVLPGIDTLLFSASTTPVPDIVALVATPSDDGILDIPGATGVNAFAVATINLGAGDTVTASAIPSAALPIALSICQTVPATGQCQAAAGASVTATIAAEATPTFSVFVSGAGTIPFEPGTNRIFVQFTGSNGNTSGLTSVAVQTQ